MSKEIQLTRGKVAIVDDEDYARLSEFSWYAQLKTMRSGKEKWYACRAGPIFMGGKRIRQTIIRMHRVILAAPDGIEVDHRNNNGLDNQKHNLRLATRSQNQANRVDCPPNMSGYRGVHWESSTRNWGARIRVRGNLLNLGNFAEPSDAARAYDAAALIHFGEYARPNFTTNL